MNTIKKTFVLVIFLFVITSCVSSIDSDSKYTDPAEIQANIDSILLVDVRTPEEFASGHIPGAINIPYTSISEIDKVYQDGTPVVLYCRSGRRSGIALDELKKLGYSQVFNFGGIGRWPYALASENEE